MKISRGAARKTLAVYLTAGYPTPKLFHDAVKSAWDEGVDLLEVGLPFSDPIADGPVIQSTSESAIKSGINYDRTLDLSSRLPPVPKVLMTYANPLFVRGWSTAFREIQQAGFSGCVLPDIPMEELTGIIPFCPRDSFYLVPLVAPTTSPARFGMVRDVARADSFIYVVSLRGITGSRPASETPAPGAPEARTRPAAGGEIATLIKGLRRVTHAPIYVGFGIQSGLDAARFGRVADGIIVGTAALKALRRGPGPYGRLLRELRRSLDHLSD